MASAERQGSGSPAAVCGRCRRPLDKVVLPGGGTTWAHPVLADHDHLPEPVDRTATGGEVVGVCDFCGTPGPAWAYPCAPFQMARHGFAGAWAACEPCHQLLEASDDSGLLNRAVASTPRELRPEVRPRVRRLHREFQAHRRGAPLAL